MRSTRTRSRTSGVRNVRSREGEPRVPRTPGRVRCTGDASWGIPLSPPPRLVVIVGATGTGKSDLALSIGEKLHASGSVAEIVSADAMQQYRGMDVGTAKVPLAMRRGIPHHMIDTLEPTEDASVSEYQRMARTVIEAIETRGNTAVLVGGSGLYVSSVIYDFRFPATDARVRARLDVELEQDGPGELHRRLQKLDHGAAAAIGPTNGRRLVRALEVVEITGQPFGSGLPDSLQPWRDALIIGLEAPRQQLIERLDQRVTDMWSSGMLDEVRTLLDAGLGVTASRAIGYAQAIAQLRGEMTEAEAIEQSAALTRRYARRQVGWFRRYHGARWIAYDDPTRDETSFALAMRKD